MQFDSSPLLLTFVIIIIIIVVIIVVVIVIVIVHCMIMQTTKLTLCFPIVNWHFIF